MRHSEQLERLHCVVGVVEGDDHGSVLVVDRPDRGELAAWSVIITSLAWAT